MSVKTTTPTPRISVLIPVYNGADSLPQSLRSVSNQTERDLEIVAVDDGSTDETLRVLREFQHADARIHVVTGPHRGIVPALNAGLAVCRAPYIARMDCDDLSHPERLRLQADYLDAHNDIGLVGCRVEFGGDRSLCAGYAHYVDWTNSLLAPGDIALNRFIESPFAHPSVMFRRELTTTLGTYCDGSFPEDYELWLRWLDAGTRMAKLPTVLVTWNDPPDRLSRTDPRYSFQAFYQCKAEYLARWLTANNPFHPHIIIWGAGRETRKRAEYLADHGIHIDRYVDVDPRKIGQVIHHRPVIDETTLPPPAHCFVVSYVSSRGARDDIRERLQSRGFREGDHFVMAG